MSSPASIAPVLAGFMRGLPAAASVCGRRLLQGQQQGLGHQAAARVPYLDRQYASTSAAAPSAAGAEGHDGDEEGPLDEQGRRRVVARVLRSSNAAELAALHFFRGQDCVRRGRIDTAFFAEQEAAAAAPLQQLLPEHHVRPSLVQGPLSLACLALGAAAALAPRRLGLAVTGAVGDALSEHYNEQLRQLNEAGAAQQVPGVRQALRTLRDLPRTPDGAPHAPDLVSVVQDSMASAATTTATTAAGNAASSTAGSVLGGDVGGSGQGGLGSGLGGLGDLGSKAQAASQGALSGVAQALQRLGLEGTVGAVVKVGTRLAIEAAART